MSVATLTATRLALHALAEQVISPLRVQVTGNEIALTARPGGFGTPELPGGGYAAVDGTEIVLVRPSGPDLRAPITSLRAAARLVGLADTEALSDEPLTVDAGAAAQVAAVFADGDAVLRRLAASSPATDDVSPIHLWPEHFDIALELGDSERGCRATYGVSPGDERHNEPYAYVAPWRPPPAGPLWIATGFTGAELPGEQLDDVDAFWDERRTWLRAWCPT